MAIYEIFQEQPNPNGPGTIWVDTQTQYNGADADAQAYIQQLEQTNGCCYAAQYVSG